MYIIHVINKIATGATLLLYVTLICGMYAQIVLGPLQLILAAIVTLLYYKKLDTIRKGLLLRYWMAAAIALALFGMSCMYWDSMDLIIIVSFFIIPMIVACYFVYVTSMLNKYIESQQQETAAIA
jgi:hypothetical protein